MSAPRPEADCANDVHCSWAQWRALHGRAPSDSDHDSYICRFCGTALCVQCRTREAIGGAVLSLCVMCLPEGVARATAEDIFEREDG